MPREIPLTRGYVAIVDDEDYERVAARKWRVVVGRWHVRAHRTQKVRGQKFAVIMARFIMDAPPGTEVDHVNGDTLDNRRCNLRVCSSSQNKYNRAATVANTSGFKGVSFHKSRGKWQAGIKRDKEKHWLGYFQSAEEAARAYDAAALRLHGEFAHLNFPPPCQEAA